MAKLERVPRAAVVIEDLTIRYRKGKELFSAVDGLSMTMNAGEITSILGPNGAGKTSTIESCEGFRRPTSGTIRVFDLDPIRDAVQLRPRVGVMLQEGGAWLGVRAGELLRYVASLYANPLDVPALLERLDLQDHAQTNFRRLSGGQRQRLCLAMAIVGRPDLVFLDEPTAGMDPHSRRATWDIIRELRDGGAGVVLSTHHMDEAENLSDRIHILKDGRLAASGTPTDLLRESRQPLLELSVKGELDFAALVRAVPELNKVVDAAAGLYSFDAKPSTELMARVASWCVDHQIELRGIRAHEPTLEELFLSLTKRVKQ